MKEFMPNPISEFYNPKSGLIFVPSGKPIGGNGATQNIIKNPVKWESWGLPDSVKIFLGLKTGRQTSMFPRLRTRISERMVRTMVKGIRMGQPEVGWNYGGSFISQKGHWVDRKKKKFYEEDSMQIVIFPSPNETWEKFKNNIKETIEVLVDELAQESVIVEFQKNGKIIETGSYNWTK